MGRRSPGSRFLKDPGSGGRLPDFLGIGVQKGGTTTLQKLLEQHPDVFLASTKELHYFSLRFREGEAWYRDQFSAAAFTQRCGEITPYYVFHPEAPARVHALLPQARLIVLLRDPVERTLSQYFHSCRLGLEALSLEQALAVEPQRLMGSLEILRADDGRHRSHQEHSYLSRSRYEQQIPAWQALYPPDQLLVLRSEDLFEQPDLVWGRVLTFLDLPMIPLPALASPANAGRGEAAQINDRLRQALRNQLLPTYVWVESRYGLRW